VLIEPDGATRLLDADTHLLLGLDDSRPRSDQAVDLAPGSTVVLYTDGLIERRGVPLNEGLEWIVHILRDRHTLDVEEVCDFLVSEAPASLEDDVAVLVLRT
jgi:serine phosphatase RsbU (regulator of sigma subunit)